MRFREIRNILFYNAKKYDFDIDVTDINTLTAKFEKMYEDYGDMYCPNQKNKRSENTICPCNSMCQKGICKCGLYKYKE